MLIRNMGNKCKATILKANAGKRKDVLNEEQRPMRMIIRHFVLQLSLKLIDG